MGVVPSDELLLPRVQHFRRPEHFGTDLDFGGSGIAQVDSEADVVLHGDELNHAAAEGKVFSLAHRKDAPAFQLGQDSFQACILGGADEQEVTILHFLDSLVPLDNQPSMVDPLIPDRLLQIPPKWVGTQHPDQNRTGRRWKSGFGPINELGKMVDIDCLELVLTRNGLPGQSRSAKGKEKTQDPY